MNRIKALTLAAALCAGSLAMAADGGVLEMGKNYQPLEGPAIAPANPDPNKVEITEFMSYSCSHCRDFQPRIDRYTQTAMPKDAYWRDVHVVWNPTPDLALAEVAAAMEISQDRKGHEKYFEYVWQTDPQTGRPFHDLREISQPDQVRQWAKSQKDWDASKFLQFYGTKKSAAEAKNMQQLTKKHGIMATPTIVVGGKYQVVVQDLGEKDFQVVTALVEKVKAERKQSVALSPDFSKGGQIAKQGL